jgi:ArsR family transcriptional regulator, cadmium/lead-responsive transcriptional repressor
MARRAKATTPAALLPTSGDAVAVVARFFRALGDPTRLRLLEFLLHDEHTVTECVAHVGLAQSRVSTHLACLADCGYVQVRRTGRYAFYRVTDPRVAHLVQLAHTLAAENHTALCACHRIPDPEPAGVTARPAGTRASIGPRPGRSAS